jgi:hypothetical protein
MKTYKIIGKTNGYIANRDPKFGGKTEIVIAKGLTLKNAQEQLLDMFNADHNLNAANWGMAVIITRDKVEGATPTFKDGTRSYEYDSRRYSIEEE